MGIINRDGALYAATGIDNTGLYAGCREAIGIIKAMAGQITSFDVFSGIGISAATAFASAAKSSYDFEKEFRKNMLEVATISTQVEGSMTDFMNQVMEITQQVPIKAPDAAKALYQIVSAGHDGAAGMNVLEVAAKSAIGGITDTVTAADAITTLLNAYKLSANNAEKVSDQLFTTARLGKTTFGEMGRSIAQVAPIAAAYGVEMDQVLAAVATLTKSGTPTAQAMTQIRASIVGVSKYLGDGAFNTMTYQEALEKVSKEANGSESALRAMIPEIEAVNGVLGLTGIKAQDAAEHLNAMNESAGATEAAFKKMQEDVDNQMTLISNNIQAALRPMGSAILKNVSEAAQMINKGFETGQIQASMETLQKLLIAVAGAFVTYKSAAIGASTAEALHSAKVTISNNLKSLQSQITGEAALSKEKERIHLEAYTASLEKSITEEQRAKLAKLDLKAGSQEYMKALSGQALQEKKNADSLVESLTKQIVANKLKLASAQESLDVSQKAVEAAKAEFNIAFEANDLAAVEVAQAKMNATAKREEAAATNVSTVSKKLKSNESKLLTVTIVAETATTRVNTATIVANAAATNVSTVAKNRLKIATAALWNTMKANPLGMILTMISLATTAYMLFADKIKIAETAQSRLNKLNKAAAESISNETAELNLLLSVAKNELLSKEDRTKAINKLNEISPEYLSNLSLENISTKETTASIEAYTKAIGRNAKAKAIMDEMNPLYREQLKYEQELYALQKKSDDLKANKLGFSDEQLYYANLDISSQIKNKAAQKASVDKQIQEVFDMYNDELSNETKSKLIKVDIPVNIQIESGQAYINTLLKKKEEIEARIKKDESSGLFANPLDAALLVTVNNELTETNNKLIALNKEVAKPTGLDAQSITEEVEVATKKVSTLKQQIADLRSGKTTAEAGKTIQSVIEDKTKELKAAEDALSTLTGQTTKETDKLLKTQQALSHSILESELKLQASRIAIMQDGKDKRILLADQEYKETLASINKEREEYKKGIKDTKGKEDPMVITAFGNRETSAKDKRNTDVANINKESAKEFIEHQKQLTDVFLTEEAKRLSSIKDRYDKEREWAKEQLKGGDMSEDQYENHNINIDEAEAQENLKSLLDKYQDYDTKRKKIDKGYNDEVATLTKQRTEANKEEVNAAIAEARKRHKEEIAALSFDAFKDTDDWKNMFGDLDKMALPALENILSKAKEVNTSAWNPEQVKEYQDAITRLEEAVRTRSPFKAIEKDWKKLLKALKEGNENDIASSLSGIDKAVQKINDDLKTMAGGIGGIFGDEAGYAAEQVTVLTSALGGLVSAASKFASGDILGAVAGTLQSIGSIFSMNRKVKEMNRAAREENQKFYDEAEKGGLEYQALIRERLRLEQQIGETALDYNKRISAELEKQKGSTQSSFDKTLKDLQGQSYISGKGYQHGTWFRKAKTWNEYSSLAGKSYEQIEQLYSQGKLDGKAKELFEQLKKLKEEGADIDKMLVDQAESFKEYISGMSFDSLKESIKSAFNDGKMDIKETADFTRDVFKKAMLQALEAKVLEKQLQPFLDSFQKDAEAGTLFDKMDFYENWIKGIADDSNKFMEGIMSIPGMEDVLKGVEEGVSGQLNAAMTEGTASQLVGLWNSTAIDMRELKNISIEQRDSVRSVMNDVREIIKQNHLIEQNTRRGADNTDGLIDELRIGFSDVSKRLGSIEKNTKTSNSRG